MKKRRYLMATVIGVVIAVPLLVYTSLYLMQERLLFAGADVDAETIERTGREYPDAEELYISTPDGTRLHGWLVRAHGKRTPLLIYFGGNNEEASGLVPISRELEGWSFLVMNYRGYGRSEGSPSEKDLFKDALFIYDLFAHRKDIDPGKIVAMGRSLGTGVAVYLASRRPLRGVVLVSPYDSITEVAKERYPYAPVSLLIKHPFDSLSRAPLIKAPLLALVAAEDRTVTPEHSMRLVERWGGPAKVKIFEGADHGSIVSSEGYWESIRGFLEEL